MSEEPIDHVEEVFVQESKKVDLDSMEESKGVAPEKQVDPLDDFEITDGKSRQEEIQKVRELEDLLGIQQMNPYKTLDRKVFEENLSFMSVAEMTSMCREVGINPPRTLRAVKNGLLESFDMYARKHNVTVQGQAQPIIDKSSPDYDSVVRLFKGE